MSVQTTRVVLAPAAQPFAEAAANPPYLFDLGPVDGRKAVDELQSGEVSEPHVDIEDTMVPGGRRGMFPCGPCAARVPHGYFQ
jgi:hypothetical protein